jgi:hypothetical protein
MLAGGAVGALGIIVLDGPGNALKAQAANGDPALRDSAKPAATTHHGEGLTAEEASTTLKGGALTGGLAPTVVTLRQAGGSVAVNASQGNVFTLSLTASGWRIASPTNPVGDGQVIRIRLSQDATGGRTVVWDAGYNWGATRGTANSAPPLTTTAHATDILGFEYVAAKSAWCFLGAAFPQAF